MKMIFNLHYKSNWGQIACVTGSEESLGKWDVDNAVVMIPDPWYFLTRKQ